MRVNIVSPRGGRDFDEVRYVSLWTPVGQMGILPGHADMVAAVVPGVVRAETPNGTVTGISGPGTLRIEQGSVHLALDHWADRAPDVEQVDQRLKHLAGELGREDLPMRARERARREISFLERWLKDADRLAG
jgi:F0F1-type ATP synthase epsilon subunit